MTEIFDEVEVVVDELTVEEIDEVTETTARVEGEEVIEIELGIENSDEEEGVEVVEAEEIEEVEQSNEGEEKSQNPNVNGDDEQGN